MVWQAVSSVLSLLILIGIGYFMAGLKWFGDSGADIFSKYSVRISIPCYMVYNVIVTCGTKEELLRVFRYMPIPVCTILFGTLLGFLFVRLFKIPAARRGVFINVMSFSNTVIIGFPVVNSLFGEEAMPYSMVYYMANTILFWTIGVFLLRKDGGEETKIFSLDGLKHIFSPPIIGFLIGCIVLIFDIKIPSFIFLPMEMIKNTVTPICMMFIGSILRQTDFKSIRLTKDLGLLLVSRFVFTPALVAAVCWFLPVDVLLKQVLFILSTMPAMTQLGIMSRESGSDYQFASVLVAVTTTISMAVLPLYALILTHFNLFA
ncbi:AEC family transporter [Treponema sp. OttesenSCG-928-L16]|nr:AEC family transporter [Treponema sp. OttesenSCG-928-L16]